MAEQLLQTLALLSSTRRIFLKNFAVECSIGIHSFERRAPQRLLISVDLYVSSAATVTGDRIEAVVDYDFLRTEIGALARSRHFNLQETLAEEILGLCLAKPAVLAVRIATAKPDVYSDCEAVGLEIFRAKAGFPGASG